MKQRILKTFILTSLLFRTASVSAQLFTGINVQVNVSTGTQLTVEGDLQMEAGGTIANNGIIDLTGNWINNSGTSVFTNAAGTVTLNGINQDIAGNSPTVFFNLDLFNGTKTLLSDATTGGNIASPSGSLNCNNTILDLNSHTFYIHNYNPSGITRTTGYILSEDTDNSSKVRWVYISQGLHTIPFGNIAGEDVSFSFFPQPGSSGSTTNNLVVSTYFTATDNIPYPVTPDLVTHVDDPSGLDNSANCVDRFWHVELNGTADYYFTYAPSDNAAAGNLNMRAQRWNAFSFGWEWPLPGQSNPTVQKVFVPMVSTNGTWTITMESTPLPVSLLDFSAIAVSTSEVRCMWITASEINNDYFIVERSKNGIEFDPIATVDGAGNSNQVLNYFSYDKKPFPGVSYYRLRQVDFDGSFHYSQTVSVRMPDEHLLFKIFPNPSSGSFYLTWDPGKGDATFIIFDIAGKQLRQSVIHNAGGSSEINLNDLPSGIYFAEVTINGNAIKEKIQIIR